MSPCRTDLGDMTSVREKFVSFWRIFCVYTQDLGRIVSFSPEKFSRIQFCVQVAVTTPKRENSRGSGTGDKGQDYKIQGDK